MVLAPLQGYHLHAGKNNVRLPVVIFALVEVGLPISIYVASTEAGQTTLGRDADEMVCVGLPTWLLGYINQHCEA